jgi:ABC-type transport system substrate-binding protein
MRDSVNADVTTFDPLTAVSLVWSFIPLHIYTGLVRRKARPVERSIEIEPDLAASWELTGDVSEIIMKLLPDAKFDLREPTNGWPLDGKGIVLIWKWSEALSQHRTDFVRSANPDAPIEAIDVEDGRTVKIEVARPDADVFNLLLWIDIQPREDSAKFDLKALARGCATGGRC